MTVLFSPAQLCVAASVFSNFVVLWLGSMLVADDWFTLMKDASFAILSWKLAVKTEELLGTYD